MLGYAGGRITECVGDLCVNKTFHNLDRFKDSYSSSSGIDVNPFQFNKYENIKSVKKCNCGESYIHSNFNIMIIIICIILFIFIKSV